MTFLSVHDDFLALLGSVPAGCPVHSGRVPDNPVFPYLLVRRFSPRLESRSLARTPHGSALRWRVTIVGMTEEAVASVLEPQVRGALEGARLGGQRVEQVPTPGEVLEDQDVKIPGGASPFYLVTEWRVSK